MAKLSRRFLKTLRSVRAKRPKTVIDHILKHGHITTEELRTIYGYNHPPRAVRDVREQGIPLETFAVKGSDGRRMAAYRFGDASKIERYKLGGRRVFSKSLKANLCAVQSGRCAICFQAYQERYLQIDHRVPYEVAGDSVADESNRNAFMLICASCQRGKSWTCEHCENWGAIKDRRTCATCYWGTPEKYVHLAMKPLRREVLTWTGDEIKIHSRLMRGATRAKIALSEYMKKLLERSASPKRAS